MSLTCAMTVVTKFMYEIPSALAFLIAAVIYLSEEGQGRSSSLHPSIMDNPETVTHTEGDMAILYCSILNLGDHTVTWRKLPQSAPLTIGTDPWTRDSRIHAEHVPNSSQWNLVIEQVDVEDAGEYECQVSKRKSRLRHTVILVVKAKPATLLPRIEISGENVLKAGNLLRLTCNASLADVALERINWIKDGQPLLLDKDHRYSIHTSVTLSSHNSGFISSKLEVKDVRTSDSGVYLCRSTERAQMAGVKVEIQGAFNSKRADMKEFDESAQLQLASQSGRNRASPSSSLGASYGLMCFISVVVLIPYVTFHAGPIT